MVVEFN